MTWARTLLLAAFLTVLSVRVFQPVTLRLHVDVAPLKPLVVTVKAPTGLPALSGHLSVTIGASGGVTVTITPTPWPAP